MLWLMMTLACGEPAVVEAPVKPDPAPSRPNVVLISVDTTRADALGAWSDQSHWGLDLPAAERPTPKTPVLDRLASSGVRFAWAFAPAPTTLSSHTAALSGLDSHRHRVVRNGFPVPPDVPLLHEMLAKAGWDTRAVVGSSALEVDMGLSRGFNAYVSPEPEEAEAGVNYMWSANSVTTHALTQVDAHLETRGANDAPLFLFAHYYDPHMPWNDAPAGIREAMGVPGYSGPLDGEMSTIGIISAAQKAGTLDPMDRRQARALYLAEVAGMDSQIGRLMAGLSKRGLLENVLVIVMSDHGETLEESAINPYSHGPEVALVDIHVPLILASFGSALVPSGKVVTQPVGLIDLPATVLSLLGVEGDSGDGIDLSPSWSGKELSVPIRFAEATRPMQLEAKDGWNNLPMERSAIGAGPDGALQLKLRPLQGSSISVHSVAPGGLAIKSDDKSTQSTVQGLRTALAGWDAAAPPHRVATYDLATHQALIELGYLDADTPPPSATPSGL